MPILNDIPKEKDRWRPLAQIEGFVFEGFQISDNGWITKDMKSFLARQPGHDIHSPITYVILEKSCNPKVAKAFTVAELVLLAWSETIKPKIAPIIVFKDGNLVNTHIDNLKWSMLGLPFDGVAISIGDNNARRPTA